MLKKSMSGTFGLMSGDFDISLYQRSDCISIDKFGSETIRPFSVPSCLHLFCISKYSCEYCIDLISKAVYSNVHQELAEPGASWFDFQKSPYPLIEMENL